MSWSRDKLDCRGFVPRGVCHGSTPAAQVVLIQIYGNGAIGPGLRPVTLAAPSKSRVERDIGCLPRHRTRHPGRVAGIHTRRSSRSSTPPKCRWVVYVASGGCECRKRGCLHHAGCGLCMAAMAPNTRHRGGAPGIAQFPRAATRNRMRGDETMKLVNYSHQLHRGHCRKSAGRNVMSGRNRRCKESASITPKRALELNVIEIIAKDCPICSTRLNGR